MIAHHSIGIALFVFTTLGGLAACTPRGSEPEEEAEEREGIADRVELSSEALAHLDLTYAKATETELVPELEVSAELMPVADRRAEIGLLVPGRIVSVHVNVGDVVAKDAPLLIVESPDVGKARAALISTTAQRSVAKKAFDRERQLLADRATSRREFEEAEGAFKKADAEHRAAIVLLATLGVPNGSGTKITDAARVEFRSPLAGTVVARNAHLGKAVDPAETLIEIVDLDELWLLADVYERDIRLVAEGQPVQVEVRAFPDRTFEGRVDVIPGTLDETTRSVKVHVLLQNPDHELRPGMFATARIRGVHDHPSQRMLAISASAVQVIDDHRAVFVRVEEGVFEVRRIHTGERVGELIEVINGLDPGDEVVGTGSFLLKGQLLRATLGEDE
ncbi:MAG: efflux RND transporter periplasmic adaptor subunit [Deltaproteobacteria bacterium]|nr:efflux RND transporter periplasmic adaptor subunit [Deltaproteobacteria bacterium]